MVTRLKVPPPVALPGEGNDEIDWEVRTGSGHRIVVGCASRTVAGKENDDRVGIARPGPDELSSHGFAVAVAGGIGTDGSGGKAAAVAISAVLDDYYATPSGWTPNKAFERVLRACNDWLHSQNMRDTEADGAVATLSLLLLKDGKYFVAHVGDTRIYRGERHNFKVLTTDHLWPRHDLRHIPKRAVGLDTHLVVDFAEGDLGDEDSFILVTDGVWEVLGDAHLRDSVSGTGSPKRIADDLVAQAMDRQAKYMGRNDASAAVVRVCR